jgi:hypothetical protein
VSVNWFERVPKVELHLHRTLILNGIRSSWLPEERKGELIADFQEDVAWRR